MPSTWRIYCATEQAWTSGPSTSIPILCFNNAAHIVNLNSQQIISNSAIISNSTDSTSASTGSLIVYGGLGVAKSMNVAGSTSLLAGLDVNTQRITRVAYPVLSSDAASKLYVDSTFPYEIYARSSVYFNNASPNPTTIPQMSLTPLQTGVYKVDFNGQFNTGLANMTAQAAADLDTFYSFLGGLAVTGTFPTFTQTVVPGVYASIAAVAIATNVTLDGQGSTASTFVFRMNGACSVAAALTFTLINSAQPDNIFFVASGAVSIGANANVSGSFLSSAALGLGAGALLNGRLLSRNGSITIAGNVYSPHAYYPYEMGMTRTFALFTSIGDITNNGSNIIVGDIGVNSGNIVGFSTATVSGTIYTTGAGSSIMNFGIYVNDVLVDSSIRERVNYIAKEDVVLSDIVSVTANQVISIKVTNLSGVSHFYNRIVTARRFS